MFQNNVCVHEGWTATKAEYIYKSLLGEHGTSERDRLSKFSHLLNGDWQIDELLRRYKQRGERKDFINKWCTGKTVMGERLDPLLYCQIRLHNWGGGHNYVARVVSKKQELYNQ